MKLSELIKKLEDIQKEVGDPELFYYEKNEDLPWEILSLDGNISYEIDKSEYEEEDGGFTVEEEKFILRIY